MQRSQEENPARWTSCRNTSDKMQADDLDTLEEALKSRSKELQTLETTIVFLNDIIAFSGNLLTLLAVLRVPRLRTVPNLFIVSLALSDILMAIPATPFCLGVMITSEWPFGDDACQFQGYYGIMLAFASTETLALMSLNRYYRIVKPNQYRRLFTRKTTFIMLISAWILASLGQLPYVLAGHRFIFHPGKIFCSQNVKEPFSFILVSIFGAIPMTVISLCCFRVFTVVREHNRQRRLRMEIQNGNRLHVEDIKISRILLTMVLAYVICFSPVMIVEAIDFFRHGSYLPREIYLFYNIMACFSCSVNPIIYGVMNKALRREYGNILRLPGSRRNRVGPILSQARNPTGGRIVQNSVL